MADIPNDKPTAAGHPAAAAASAPPTPVAAAAAPAAPAAAAKIEAKLEAQIEDLKDTPAHFAADKKKLETRIAELEDELHRLRTSQGLVHKTKKSSGWVPVLALENED
jgi:hypothetical protein